MYGYDVTYRVLYSEEDIRRVEQLSNRTSGMVASLLRYFMASHNRSLKHLNLQGVAPIHDACAVAGVIDPRLITDSRQMHVDIGIGGEYFDGATICDYTDSLKLPKNVEVVYNMDVPRFLQLLIDSTAKCL